MLKGCREFKKEVMQNDAAPYNLQWEVNENRHQPEPEKISLKGEVMALPSWARGAQYSNIDLQSHVTELIEAFKALDTDNDGFITSADLKQAMEDHGKAFTLKQA